MKAFGVSPISVKWWVKKYREQGARGFFLNRRLRSGTVLTSDTSLSIQQHYHSGLNIEEISPLVGVKTDTINKAIRQGQLRLPERGTDSSVATIKSLRNQIDSSQPMSKACVNTLERVLASKGIGPCLPSFQKGIDLGHGGVLLSLVALIH